MSSEFEKYIKMQKDSADKHKSNILEHDGYVLSSPDKFFVLIYDEDPTRSGLKIISLSLGDLFKYKVVRDLGSMMPLVRLKE